jgi:ribonucleoside-diphosphate reductase alpha chain
LKDLVNKFSHLRFEPAGFTTNREIPMAKSLVDYIFRYLATKFMSRDDQDHLGVINRQLTLSDAPAVSGEAAADTVASQASATLSAAAQPQVEAGPTREAEVGDPVEPIAEVPEEAVEEAASILDGLKIVAKNGEAKRSERLEAGQPTVIFDTADSPACTDCGSIMVRNGSCYKCINCGSTSGCS